MSRLLTGIVYQTYQKRETWWFGGEHVNVGRTHIFSLSEWCVSRAPGPGGDIYHCCSSSDTALNLASRRHSFCLIRFPAAGSCKLISDIKLKPPWNWLCASGMFTLNKSTFFADKESKSSLSSAVGLAFLNMPLGIKVGNVMRLSHWA